MRWFYVFLFVLVGYILLQSVESRRMDVPGSVGFGKHSYNMYVKMYKNKMGENDLRDFVRMENQLLKYERDVVCVRLNYDPIVEATSLSEQIKERFLGYDFSYHTKILKQISEPDKVINRELNCFQY